MKLELQEVCHSVLTYQLQPAVTSQPSCRFGDFPLVRETSSSKPRSRPYRLDYISFFMILSAGFSVCFSACPLSAGSCLTSIYFPDVFSSLIHVL